MGSSSSVQAKEYNFFSDVQNVKESESGDFIKKKIKRQTELQTYAASGINNKFNNEQKSEPLSEDVVNFLIEALKKNFIFCNYDVSEFVDIVHAFVPTIVIANTFLFRQGDVGDKFYIVENGMLSVIVNDNMVKRLLPGCSFGELALINNCPRAASIKSEINSIVWWISRDICRNIIFTHRQLENMKYFNFLKSVKIMGKVLGEVLDEDSLYKLTGSLEKEDFQCGEYIIQEGDVGEKFYIIACGNVDVCKENDAGNVVKIQTLNKVGYFGEQALLKNDIRQASCIAASGVTCMTLERHAFVELLGSLEDLVAAPALNIATIEFRDTSYLLPELSLASLELSAVIGDIELGRAEIGAVRLGSIAGSYYAVKCLRKGSIVEARYQDQVLREISLWRTIDHPAVAKFYGALQDNCNVYFITELLQGGELLHHLSPIRTRRNIQEVEVAFYCATVVSALHYLHRRKVCYRDLRPENMMLDGNGYTKLVNFSLAKHVPKGKTFTLCGAPEYTAPEVILNEGHDKAVDYWALGILIYELMFGYTPFEESEDDLLVYGNILQGKFYCANSASKHLKDIVNRLLHPQATKRLGNTFTEFDSIYKHEWFSCIDWCKLDKGLVEAPFAPIVVSNDDVLNFHKHALAPPEDATLLIASDWEPNLAL